MKRVYYNGISFKIDPNDYHDVDHMQRHTGLIPSYVSSSSIITIASIGCSFVWTPQIVEYFGASDLTVMQEYMACALFFTGFQSTIFGLVLSTDMVENIYDSCRFTFDYTAAVIGGEYDSWIQAPKAG